MPIRWEYKVISIEHEAGKAALKAYAFQTSLNEFGEQGWELVSTTYLPLDSHTSESSVDRRSHSQHGGVMYYYFKRPLVE